MITPDFATFKKLSKKGNVIPVVRQILADVETPVSAFLKIDSGAYCYLLESVESQEHVGRYSFLSVHPSMVFETKGRTITFTNFSKGYKSSRAFQCTGSPNRRALGAW